MAKTKFEYVRLSERNDELLDECWIVCQINICNSKIDNFPSNILLQELKNDAAVSILSEFDDIAFSFGFGGESNFVFKPNTTIFERRKCKIASTVVSKFSACFHYQMMKASFEYDIKDFECCIYLFPNSDLVKHFINDRQAQCKLLVSRKNSDSKPYILNKSCLLARKKLLHSDYVKKAIATKTKSVLLHVGELKSDSFWKSNFKLLSIDNTVKSASGSIEFSRYAQDFFLERQSSLRENFSSATLKFGDILHSEINDELLDECWIVCQIKMCNMGNDRMFRDILFQELMNDAAVSIITEFDDIALAYGFGGEFNFVFRPDSDAFQRQGAKLTNTLMMKFSAFFHGHLRRVSMNWDIKDFEGSIYLLPNRILVKRFINGQQTQCHTWNIYQTCLWKIIDAEGKTHNDAISELNKTDNADKNELLFLRFNCNYNNEPAILKKGCLLARKELFNVDSVKKAETTKTESVLLHIGELKSDNFWQSNSELLAYNNKTIFNADSAQFSRFSQTFILESDSWFVCRIDGRGFHRFSDQHCFIKPNDARALSLMNWAAAAVMEAFPDIVLAYGQSDEYSFVFGPDHKCREPKEETWILTAVAALFSAVYTREWSHFFPDNKLHYAPTFDSRIVSYPRSCVLKDYLRWRQADCHINNLYNTCFWNIVLKEGRSKKEAENELKDTFSADKRRLLQSRFGIAYESDESAMMRKGSVLLREKLIDGEILNSADVVAITSGGGVAGVLLYHGDIMEEQFWSENPRLLT